MSSWESVTYTPSYVPNAAPVLNSSSDMFARAVVDSNAADAADAIIGALHCVGNLSSGFNSATAATDAMKRITGISTTATVPIGLSPAAPLVVQIPVLSYSPSHIQIQGNWHGFTFDINDYRGAISDDQTKFQDMTVSVAVVGSIPGADCPDAQASTSSAWASASLSSSWSAALELMPFSATGRAFWANASQAGSLDRLLDHEPVATASTTHAPSWSYVSVDGNITQRSLDVESSLIHVLKVRVFDVGIDPLLWPYLVPDFNVEGRKFVDFFVFFRYAFLASHDNNDDADLGSGLYINTTTIGEKVMVDSCPVCRRGTMLSAACGGPPTDPAAKASFRPPTCIPCPNYNDTVASWGGMYSTQTLLVPSTCDIPLSIYFDAGSASVPCKVCNPYSEVEIKSCDATSDTVCAPSNSPQAIQACGAVFQSSDWTLLDGCATPGFSGPACTTTAPNFWNSSSTWRQYQQPIPCRCDAVGTASQVIPGRIGMNYSTTLCDAASGACACKAGFTGPLCDKCAAGRYGSNCTGVCACGVHGTCIEGRSGSGQCVCEAGWMGSSGDCTSAPSSAVFVANSVASQLVPMAVEGSTFSLALPSDLFLRLAPSTIGGSQLLLVPAPCSSSTLSPVTFNMSSAPAWLRLVKSRTGCVLTGTPDRGSGYALAEVFGKQLVEITVLAPSINATLAAAGGLDSAIARLLIHVLRTNTAPTFSVSGLHAAGIYAIVNSQTLPAAASAAHYLPGQRIELHLDEGWTSSSPVTTTVTAGSGLSSASSVTVSYPLPSGDIFDADSGIGAGANAADVEDEVVTITVGGMPSWMSHTIQYIPVDTRAHPASSNGQVLPPTSLFRRHRLAGIVPWDGVVANTQSNINVTAVDGAGAATTLQFGIIVDAAPFTQPIAVAVPAPNDTSLTARVDEDYDVTMPILQSTHAFYSRCNITTFVFTTTAASPATGSACSWLQGGYSSTTGTATNASLPSAFAGVVALFGQPPLTSLGVHCTASMSINTTCGYSSTQQVNVTVAEAVKVIPSARSQIVAAPMIIIPSDSGAWSITIPASTYFTQNSGTNFSFSVVGDESALAINTSCSNTAGSCTFSRSAGRISRIGYHALLLVATLNDSGPGSQASNATVVLPIVVSGCPRSSLITGATNSSVSPAACSGFGTCTTSTNTCACAIGYVGPACDQCAPLFSLHQNATTAAWSCVSLTTREIIATLASVNQSAASVGVSDLEPPAPPLAISAASNSADDASFTAGSPAFIGVVSAACALVSMGLAMAATKSIAARKAKSHFSAVASAASGSATSAAGGSLVSHANPMHGAAVHSPAASVMHHLGASNKGLPLSQVRQPSQQNGMTSAAAAPTTTTTNPARRVNPSSTNRGSGGANPFAQLSEEEEHHSRHGSKQKAGDRGGDWTHEFLSTSKHNVAVPQQSPASAAAAVTAAAYDGITSPSRASGTQATGTSGGSGQADALERQLAAASVERAGQQLRQRAATKPSSTGNDSRNTSTSNNVGQVASAISRDGRDSSLKFSPRRSTGSGNGNSDGQSRASPRED